VFDVFNAIRKKSRVGAGMQMKDFYGGEGFHARIVAYEFRRLK
jgi:hypothetical protein